MTPRELGLWLDDINDDVTALNADIKDRPGERQSNGLLGAWQQFRTQKPWEVNPDSAWGWEAFYEDHEGVIDQRLKFDEGKAGAEKFAMQLRKLWLVYKEEGGTPTKPEPKLAFDGVDPVDEVVETIKEEARTNALRFGFGVGAAAVVYYLLTS